MKKSTLLLPLLLALLLLSSPAALAQSGYVTVTASIPPYFGGQVTASYINQSSAPQLPLLNGSVFPTIGVQNLDATGTFKMTIADNLVITPTPSVWNFTLCAKAGNQGQPCFPVQATITCVGNPSCVNGVLDISSLFANAPPPPLPPGSLPVASFPGQMITSVSLGQLYAVQPQIFYSHNGDTLASIESRCTAGCAYIVTQPQVITLSANHGMSSNVNIYFAAGGTWTVNGAFTLTFNTRVEGNVGPHFFGSAAIAFSALQEMAPVEWFGATGDGAGGTDDTAAIQACVNALIRGQCHLQAQTYTVSAPITINKSHVGLDGVEPGLSSPTLYPTPSPSKIVSTSPTADVIDVAGTSGGNTVAFNRFTNFSLGRTVAPVTSGATPRGLSLIFVDGPYVSGITSADSQADFFIHGMASQGVGVIQRCVAIWGYDGVTETTGGSLGGFVLDSSNGVTNNSARFEQDGAFSNLPHSPTAAYQTFGFTLQGDQTHDAFVDRFESATVDFGLLISQTNGGGIAGSTDIHFTNMINDSCFVTCLKVTQILGSVEISGGWEATSVVATNTPVIEIDNSTRVNVSHVDVFASAGSAGTPAIKVDSSTLTRIENNNVSVLATSAEDGISYTNDTGGIITGNTVLLAGAGSTNGITIANASTGLDVSLNSVQGNAVNGIIVAAGCNGIAGLSTNTIGATLFGGITNLLVDNGINPQFANTFQNGVNGSITKIRQIVDQTGSPLCSAPANGNCSFVLTFPNAFPDTNWRQLCYAMTTSGAGAIWGGTSRSTTAVTVSWHDMTGVTNNLNEVVCEGFE